jgi:hypothetical protein
MDRGRVLFGERGTGDAGRGGIALRDGHDDQGIQPNVDGAGGVDDGDLFAQHFGVGGDLGDAATQRLGAVSCAERSDRSVEQEQRITSMNHRHAFGRRYRCICLS